MLVRKTLYAVLAIFCLALGLVGLIMPFLPGLPFLVLAIVCLSAASTRVAALVDRHPASVAWQARWRRSSSLPVLTRMRLMFWLTADALLRRGGSVRP